MLSALYPDVNTDYFPFLDLNATAARFKRENAGALLTLRTSALPIADMVSGNYKPLETLTLTPTENDPNYFVQIALDAKLIRAQILSPDPGSSFVLFDNKLPHELRSITFSCNARISYQTWQNSVLTFVNAMSFLSPEELAPVWSFLRQQRCKDDEAELVEHWIDMLDAINRKQMAAIIVAADELLESKTLTANATVYVTLAKGMALAADGRYLESSVLFESVGLNENSPGMADKLLYIHSLGNR